MESFSADVFSLNNTGLCNHDLMCRDEFGKADIIQCLSKVEGDLYFVKLV